MCDQLETAQWFSRLCDAPFAAVADMFRAADVFGGASVDSAKTVSELNFARCRATLVVAQFERRAPLTGLVKRAMPGSSPNFSSSAGNRG